MAILEKAKVTDVHLLREKSLWKDSKGRTLLVWNRWFEGYGSEMRCTEVDLLIVDTLTVVRRPQQQLATYIENGKMKYAGQCSDGKKKFNLNHNLKFL
jgi:hypothetical protein